MLNTSSAKELDGFWEHVFSREDSLEELNRRYRRLESLSSSSDAGSSNSVPSHSLGEQDTLSQLTSRSASFSSMDSSRDDDGDDEDGFACTEEPPPAVATLAAFLEDNDDDDGFQCRVPPVLPSDVAAPSRSSVAEFPASQAFSAEAADADYPAEIVREADRIVQQVFSSSSPYAAFKRAPSRSSALLLFTRMQPAVVYSTPLSESPSFSTTTSSLSDPQPATTSTMTTTTTTRSRGLTFLHSAVPIIYSSLQAPEACANQQACDSALAHESRVYGMLAAESGGSLPALVPDQSSSHGGLLPLDLSVSSDDLPSASSTRTSVFDAVVSASDEVFHRYEPEPVGGTSLASTAAGSSLGAFSLLSSVGNDYTGAGSFMALADAEAMVASIFQ